MVKKANRQKHSHRPCSYKWMYDKSCQTDLPAVYVAINYERQCEKPGHHTLTKRERERKRFIFSYSPNRLFACTPCLFVVVVLLLLPRMLIIIQLTFTSVCVCVWLAVHRLTWPTLDIFLYIKFVLYYCQPESRTLLEALFCIVCKI